MMENMKLGFMGVHNSFSEKASKVFAKNNGMADISESQLLPLVDAFHVRDALVAGDITYGVVAIRNSITGMVAETEEAFRNMDICILDEFALPIHQCFFKLPGTPIENITTVASHPQALMQTRNTRQQLVGKKIELTMEDTALSAKMLSDGKLSPDTAVVCSLEAGLMNGLELIRENIEDKSDNKTYFRMICLADQRGMAA
ncbi:MAG: hypothetical protein MJ116_06585 [Lachnospiraceae bacterium]|nr:hypothetical protein [Lachnospiraceae bacterium]